MRGQWRNQVHSTRGQALFKGGQQLNAVVLKLDSTEPQGFGETVAGVRLRSE